MTLLNRVNLRFEEILTAGSASTEMTSLQKQMAACNMIMKGKAFPTFLKPYLIDAKDKQIFHEATELIISACEKVGNVFFTDERFAHLLEMKARVAEFARIDPIYPNRQIVARLDAFYNPKNGDLKFLEFNTDSPCGMGWHDRMVDMFKNLATMLKLGEEYKLKADKFVDTLAKCFQKKYREWCQNKGIEAKENPHFVISTIRESTVLDDLQIIRDIFIDKGIDSSWCDPREFETKDGILYANGKPVDLIFRDDNQEFLSEDNYPKAIVANEAIRNKQVPLINPFSARVGGLKSVLGIMSDEKFHDIFTEKELDAFKKYIPWTRLVREGQSQYQGERIELRDFILENKNNLVLKPNSGYGGFGVIIGPDVEQKEWQKTLEHAMKNNYVVQEMVELPKDYFPVLDEKHQLQGFSEKNVNINFWAFDGKFGGAFVRASDSSIINVHQGGGLVPCFYVEE